MQQELGRNQVIIRALVGSPHNQDTQQVASWQARVSEVEAENAILTSEFSELEAYALDLASKIQEWTIHRGLMPESERPRYRDMDKSSPGTYM